MKQPLLRFRLHRARGAATLAAMRLAITALVLLVTQSAWADGRVAIIVDGKLDLSSSLPTGWTVREAADFDSALQAQGQHGAIGKALKSKDRAELFGRVRRAATADNDQAVILASVDRAGKTRRVTLVVIDPARDGAPALDTHVTLPLTAGPTDAKKLAAALDAPLTAITPAPPSPAVAIAVTPVESPAQPVAASPDAPFSRTLGDPTRSAVQLSCGFALGSRHFYYRDALTTNLRPYDVDAAPMLAVTMLFHPFADATAMRDFGFYGDYISAVGLGSATRNGSAVGTSWSRYDVGANVRVRLGNKERPVLVGLSAGYGLELFRFTDATTIDPELPSVAYGFVRGMADVRIPVGPVAFSASVAYLHVVANGEVGLRVRGTRNDGVEGSLGVALPFAHVFEARLSGTYTRFYFSFSPVPGDLYVAGGALDQFLTGQFALAWIY